MGPVRVLGESARSVVVQGNRGPDAAHTQCPADVVGVDPAAGGAAVTGGAGPGRRTTGRRAVLRPVPGPLRPHVRAPVDPGGDLPAADVPEGPLPAGLRDAVRRGDRLD